MRKQEGSEKRGRRGRSGVGQRRRRRGPRRQKGSEWGCIDLTDSGNGVKTQGSSHENTVIRTSYQQGELHRRIQGTSAAVVPGQWSQCRQGRSGAGDPSPAALALGSFFILLPKLRLENALGFRNSASLGEGNGVSKALAFPKQSLGTRGGRLENEGQRGEAFSLRSRTGRGPSTGSG